MEASISSPSLWHLETLSEQSEEKLEKSQGTTRDVAIAVGRHVSLLIGKGWVIHNWGLVRTCVRVFMGDIFLFDLWDNNNNNRGKKMRRGEKE